MLVLHSVWIKYMIMSAMINNLSQALLMNLKALFELEFWLCEFNPSLFLRVTQIPGCILAATLGVLVDVPIITLIVLYKTPVLLYKGWHRLIQDLIGREGPFLETVCVPFAAIWILLWPIVVLLATLVGILSSLGFGCYAAVVAYQVWIWSSDTCSWLVTLPLFQCFLLLPL